MLPRICIKFKLKYFISVILAVLLLDYLGAFTHVFEEDFDQTFHYPMEGDILSQVYQLRHGQRPSVDPINSYNYSYITDCSHKCKEDDRLIAPRLVLIVKSAMKNFDRRVAIRKSWGWEKRFSDVKIRTVFMLGRPAVPDRRLQSLIDLEYANYRDIVQGDFVDAYFNNTIKTMMGFRWAVTQCPRAKFYMFADDDFYVSSKNLLKYVRNPVNYPEYLEETDEALRKLARRLSQTTTNNNSSDSNSLESNGTRPLVPPKKLERKKRQILNMDMELPSDVKLFSGFVFRSAPHRHRCSKWYVSLKEYPWHMWPTYVTAGAFLLSHEALFEMYYVSMYTKHFRFDDIYLGIVALKAGIEPLHSEEFYFHKAPFLGPQSYKYVLATHGYDDPEELVKIWNEVRAAGYA
ncbi:beta-1,3-galactosyltransferase brn-like [Uranotaenia lowii]|uniref:beta-1,3-galactosyltransferase brn-like n=1 Tax=Uranotaenia lowii TaxID=190385 RepID=UPI00247B03A5|nr:beta-1,3-galactosyltransferase brn-like [Uranotaenia lowii]XP_055606571.1 beta-1,3-galactosyltransferase brn-like [Uranotaenia lowii]XP_055606573.1 beta-1,3-galactosyltransferase brn-like [Uranotaenia lowii]XP_055606574.1 beta-1,3-galactosyltransferase brn-like [Uranotaenia lowii]